MTYSNVYYEFFGPFERRLNRALRGRSAEEEERLQQQEQQREQAGQEQDEGLWATLWGLGNAVIGLFGNDDEVIIEAEVRVGGARAGIEAAEIQQEVEQLEQEIEVEAAQAGRQRAREMARQEGEGEQPAQQAEMRAPPAEDRNQQAAAAAADENRPTTTLTDVVNSVVTSLLFPVISYGMGELLRLTLPRGWIKRPLAEKPTGLLQQRWGRSLVGGCLFVVLKDAFVLYAKYRRVQVKQRRKVRDVERRKPAQGEDSS
jgi:hypothetical protein